jgi:hypothetical protein
VAGTSFSLRHLVALTDDVGILQHADFDVPNRIEGYCTDDVARAFIVAVRAAAHESEREEALRLGRIYLAFLRHAQLPDGRFHNFMSYDRTWLDEAGGEDSLGRAIWALGVGVLRAPLESWRRQCTRLLERAARHVLAFEYLRSRALAALGLADAYEAGGRTGPLETTLRAIAADLVARLAQTGDPQWRWFENELTYDNARLPEALLRIGTVLQDPTFVAAGLETLAFYESIVVENGTFGPIGNDGWYIRGGHRARYAQQPLEAAALVDAALAAEAATGRAAYRRLAECAFAWYHGRNSEGAVMTANGGCFDGLDEHAVNQNMGAESTLSYLACALSLARTKAEPLRAVQ